MPTQRHDEFDPVSANTLFHFTDSVDNILSILTNDFQPRYCLEDFRIFRPVEGESLEMAIPMVCFCDLPLFSIKKHLSFYGRYGIGMSKLWGQTCGISPVFYLTPNSPLSKAMGSILLVADRDEGSGIVPESVIQKSDMLTSYIKPYEGSMWRRGRYLQGVRFYDEREWRFVPTGSPARFRTALTRTQFQNESLREQENGKIADQTLHFGPDDIKYLILKSEDEILPMVRAVERIKSKFNLDIVKLLTTRILTLDQIREDF